MGVAVCNAAMHKIGWYAEQARDTSANLGALLLISAGLQADATLSDHATVAAALAATNDEATFTNYVRKSLVSPVVTVDNTLDQVRLGLTGAAPVTIQWAAAGGAVNNLLGKACIYYDPTPGSSTDAQLIPLVWPDVAAQTDGTTLVLTLHDDGWCRVRKP
jgi:hypothetical protein